MRSLKNIFKARTKRSNQSGLASIVVVLMLTIVISLLSLGLAKLMDRVTQQSVGNNLSTAADFAAQSGINDVTSLLKVARDTSASKCGDLIDPIANADTSKPPSNNIYTGQASQLSPNTKYTCILINRNPKEITYQNIQPFKSQIVALTPDHSAAKFLVSWQASDRNYTEYPSLGNGKLYDETTWANNKYVPALSLTIYLFNHDLLVSGIAQETYYLYPNAPSAAKPYPAPSTVDVDTVDDSISPPATFKKVTCGAQKVSSTVFDGKADFDCNIIINKLPTNKDFYYYMKITPLYGKADVKIQANDKATPPKAIDLGGSQYDVDVTARSGNAVKRLRASVSTPFSDTILSILTSNDNSFPEYPLQTANTICKRLITNSSTEKVTIDPGSAAYCGMPWLGAAPNGPHITFWADQYSIGYNKDTNLKYVVAPEDPAVSCTMSGGRFGSGTTVDKVSDGLSTGNLKLTTTYTLSCKDAANKISTQSIDIVVDGPTPPVLNFYAQDPSLPYGNNGTKLTWRISGGAATWCWATGGPWGSGQFLPQSQLALDTNFNSNTGALANTDKHQPKTYNYTMQCGNDTTDYKNFYGPAGYKTSILNVGVRVNPQYPLPVLKFSSNPAPPIPYNSAPTLTWTISNGPATWCWGWGGEWGGGSTESGGKWLAHDTGDNTDDLLPQNQPVQYNIKCGNDSSNYKDCGNSCGKNGGYEVGPLIIKFVIKPKPQLTVKIDGAASTDRVISTDSDGNKIAPIDCKNNGNSGTCTMGPLDGAKTIYLDDRDSDGTLFTGWSSPCVIKNGLCKINLDDNYTVTATFELKN